MDQENKASAYDDPNLGLQAQRDALESLRTKLDPDARNLPMHVYLDELVMPLLIQGMSELVEDRPEEPVEWLSTYLLKNNPMEQPAVSQP